MTKTTMLDANEALVKNPAPGPRLAKYLAESVGTFCLVFAGTGAVIVDQTSGGRLGVLGIGVVFGLIVLAMIYAIGHISGAHMNPAVSLGFTSAGRLSPTEAWRYILAQLAGAVAASVALKLIFLGSPTSLGLTVPAGPWWQGFAMEFFLTAILMFVIMGVATDERAESALAGLAIGGTICLEAVFGGPISGASMNPARSFAPALMVWNFSAHWIYWLAPISGSIVGARIYEAIRCRSSEEGKSGCC